MSTSLYLDPSNQQEFKTLLLDGKNLAAQGKLKESLKKFELAKLICPTTKVLQRIEKLKVHMRSLGIPLPSDENSSPTEIFHDALSDQKSHNKIKSDLPLTEDDPAAKVLCDIQNVKESKVSGNADLSPTSLNTFNEFKRIAKKLSYEGRFEEAKDCFKKALKLYDCPKVKRYIHEIELAIARSNNEESSQANSVITKFQSLSSESSEVPPKVSCSGSSTARTSVKSLSKNMNYDKGCLLKDNDPIGTLSKGFSKSSTGSETDSNLSDRESKKLDKVKELYYEARDLASNGQLVEALKLLQKAQNIHFTQKVQKQIDKLQEHLTNREDDGDEMVRLSDDFYVFKEIYNKLYPYQREGVSWMWKLFNMNKGGVLGDDMGLGKTFQVIAFLSGMIDSERAKHVLIVMPVSLISTWEKEFKKWSPGISVHSFHGGSKKERERNLLRVQKRGHVLLTSYGMLCGNVDSLVHCEEGRFVWDYVILDEGHKIKNPTKTTKAVHEISSRNRLVLTGTPIQNNLKELWSLYDFVHHGTLLGSLKTFKMQYENPITRSREKDATVGEKRLGFEMAENLKSLIKPYFLRRTKDEIWGKKSNGVDELEHQFGNLRLTVRKNDLIIWTFMTEPQIEIYKSFLHSDAVKSILMSRRSPLVELTILKKICDHPRLLSKRACLQLGLDGKVRDEDLLQELENEENLASTIENVPDETLLLESGKLNLVITLLEHLRADGHRTLVFSLSRKILDMIQRILANRKWPVMRLDGTIVKREERERRIQKFQNDSRYPVFLITTQVGGVGITLTSADRVIIYDPSWNPATDAQAVDRVYRIGQQKNVVVYRMITCGTVEEKIYRRQIFKDSITRQTTTSTGSSDPYRYFSKQELRELFSLDDPYTSKTQTQLSELHSNQRNTDDALDNHISYLQSLNIYGISDHDLMFSKEIKDPTEDNDENGISYDYIKRQVATAQELIAKETSVVAGSLKASGAFYRPYQETVPLTRKDYLKDTYKPPAMPEVVDLTEDAQDIPSNFPPPDVQGIEQRNSTLIESSEAVDICSFSVTPKNDQKLSSKNKKSVAPKEQSNLIPKLIQNEPFAIENASPKIEKDSLAAKSFSKVGDQPSTLLAENNSFANTTAEKSSKKEGAVSISPSHGKSLFHNDEASIQGNSVIGAETFCNVTQSGLPELRASDVSRRVLLEDNLSLNIEDSIGGHVVKNRRKSCARKSIFIDSDTSEHGSCPPSLNNNAAQLVEESDDEEADSSNSESLSCVPDSVPNTPEIIHNSAKRGKNMSVSSTPVKPKSIFAIKQESSARRITPLKVRRSMTKLDSSFVKALAASPLFEFPPSTNPTVANIESIIEDDSPIKFSRKRTNPLSSESEESEAEGDISHHVETINNPNDSSEESDYGFPPGELENVSHSTKSAESEVEGDAEDEVFETENEKSVLSKHSSALFSEAEESGSEYEDEENSFGLSINESNNVTHSDSE